MFGRQFRATEHRQHMPLPTSPGYTFERVGTKKVADRWVLDEIANASGMVTPLKDGWEVILSSDGPLLHKEMDANGYDGAAVTPPSVEGAPWGWRVNARLFQVHVGSGFANTAEEAMAACEEVYADYKRTASRKTAAVTWYDQSDQFGGLWSTYQGSAPDSPNGMINEAHGMYRWYVSDSGTRGNQQTGEVSSLEEAKRAAEQALASLGVTASRTASRRTAFLDTIEIAEPRHRVAGWDWSDHLNGFVAVEAAREFTCSCGDNVPAPGYTDCRCGKRWNAYQVVSNGERKMIAREVPVRENVVMARTASRRTAETIDSENLQVGDVVKYGDETITIIGEQEYWEDPFGRDMMKYMARSSDGREGYVMFGYGASLPVVASTRTASRKVAAPSSGADAIAQYFPGWRVDDENGNFWEIQSPGGEHAFIHEEDGTYTVLTNDNTPDEFWETGLSFDEALEEMRAEGVL